MIDNRVLWNKSDSKSNVKKCFVSLRIVQEEILSVYQDYAISAPSQNYHDYTLKNKSVTIDGSKILDVATKLFRC